MTTLHNILSARDSKTFATASGTKMHIRLRHIVLEDDTQCGDSDLISKIQQRSDLVPFFCRASKTEVPIAGTIKGRFISRRIDRLLVNHDEKTVKILDYKTDINPNERKSIYVSQINEYIQLMRAIYPGYKISGYILWTHDFLLEKIPSKPL